MPAVTHMSTKKKKKKAEDIDKTNMEWGQQLKYGCQVCPGSTWLDVSLVVTNIDSSSCCYCFLKRFQLGMAWGLTPASEWVWIDKSSRLEQVRRSEYITLLENGMNLAVWGTTISKRHVWKYLLFLVQKGTCLCFLPMHHSLACSTGS